MIMSMLTPQFAIPGGMELVVILLIILLLFGARKIPELARSTGQATGEFKRGNQGLEAELRELENDEQSRYQSDGNMPR